MLFKETHNQTLYRTLLSIGKWRMENGEWKLEIFELKAPQSFSVIGIQ